MYGLTWFGQRPASTAFARTEVGNGRKRGRQAGSLKGRKVAPKYRGPDGETWAGRGATPRWMATAIKSSAKKDDFLIAKAAAAVRKKSTAKKSKKKAA